MTSQTADSPAAVIGNVVSAADARKRTLSALRAVAEILSQTLGPYGRNVLVQDQMHQHFATKDGHTVMSRIMLTGDVEQTVLAFLRKVSSRLDRTVGDGTTSSVVIAEALLRSLVRVVPEGTSPPAEVCRVLTRVIDGVKDRLVKMAVPCDPTLLVQVATISANNDPEVGGVVFEAVSRVGEHGLVRAVASTGSSHFVQFSSGMEHPRGMVAPHFATDKETVAFRASDAVVAVFSAGLTSRDVRCVGEMLNHVIGVRHRPVVLVAPGFDQDFLNFLLSNKAKMRDAFPVCPVDASVASSHSLQRLYDLAAFCGARTCEPGVRETATELFERVNRDYDGVLGLVGDVEVTENRMVLSDPTPEAIGMLEVRAAAVRDEIRKSLGAEDGPENREVLAQLRSRLSGLSGDGAAVISIAGGSDQERRTKLFLAEDAICAAQSALRHGVIAGCGMSSLLAAKEVEEEEFGYSGSVPCGGGSLVVGVAGALVSALGDYFLAVVTPAVGGRASAILEECLTSARVYDAVSGEYADVDLRSEDATGIVNSVQTDIEILTVASSIVSLLLTSASFVSATNMNSAYSPKA